MHRKSHRSRTLRFESLENRALLAGDVTVSVVNHNLLVRGDDGDDTVFVSSEADGSIDVYGLHTTINGTSSTFNASSIQNLSIVLGDGNDSVNLAGYSSIVPLFIVAGGQPIVSQPAQPLQFSGNVSIIAGNGNDTVGIGTTKISGNLSITLGGGNDSVGVGTTTVHGDVNIRGGDGNDSIFLSGPPSLSTPIVVQPLYFPSSIIGPVPFSQSVIATTTTSVSPSLVTWVTTSAQFQGNVSVTLGKGTDSVSVQDADIKGSLTIDTGAGRDIIEVGRPLITMANAANLTGNGSDLTIGGVMSVIGGGGGDQVTLNTLKAKIIDVVTGQGADNLSLAGATADALFAALGAGDDTFDTSNGNNSINSLIAFGNAGHNTFRNATSNHFPRKFLFGFDSTG